MPCPSNPELGSGRLPEVNMFLHLEYLVDSQVSQMGIHVLSSSTK